MGYSTKMIIKWIIHYLYWKVKERDTFGWIWGNCVKTPQSNSDRTRGNGFRLDVRKFFIQSAEALAQLSRSCGCPIPGGTEGQAGWGPWAGWAGGGQPCTWHGLGLGGLWGPFQPKPFCDPMCSERKSAKKTIILSNIFSKEEFKLEHQQMAACNLKWENSAAWEQISCTVICCSLLWGRITV